jgi:TonB family protein
MPPLFSRLPASYPVPRTNFLASFLLHTVVLALLVSSGAWFVSKNVSLPKADNISAELSPYVLTVAPKASGGGGGGGDRDKLDSPQGRLPRQAREQFTPPAVVLRNIDPKHPREPTVVAPPVNIATNLPNIGDPFSKVPLGPPSNGTGSGSGIGSGYGGGVGSGRGPGSGTGIGGGVGGGVYRVGGGVSAPRVLYSPDPSYSEEARKAKYQGTVVLWTVIGADGRPRDIRLARSLGMGLDQKAIEALRQWKFEPALKDGHPVPVQINVEINFRLY